MTPHLTTLVDDTIRESLIAGYFSVNNQPPVTADPARQALEAHITSMESLLKDAYDEHVITHGQCSCGQDISCLQCRFERALRTKLYPALLTTPPPLPAAKPVLTDIRVIEIFGKLMKVAYLPYRQPAWFSNWVTYEGTATAYTTLHRLGWKSARDHDLVTEKEAAEASKAWEASKASTYSH